MKDYTKQYNQQKSSAKRRGIDWQFTYESWVAWWGDDIERRGTGHDKLCMQRFGDSGPYHPDNVRKDYARQNRKTAAVIQKHGNLAKRWNFQQTDEDWVIVHRAFFPEAA